MIEEMAKPPDHQITKSNFGGLKVASFESRMATEMARLIERYGGQPLVAPAMREVPLEDNAEALRFGEQLLAGQYDFVILLTGVGTRTLLDVLQTRYPLADLTAALARTTLLVRGPKPLAVLKEFGLTAQLTVPEPNTWRDLLAVLDQQKAKDLTGLRIAVQDYGVPNQELLAALRERGAQVTHVPVYRWALPDDTAPLRAVLEALLAERVDVVLITNAVQVDHVMQVLTEQARGETGPTRLRQALSRMVVGSIGPTASERLRSYGWPVDLEPSHPKMGILVKETSERAHALLRAKRSLLPHPFVSGTKGDTL